jgi:hypothetical protein
MTPVATEDIKSSRSKWSEEDLMQHAGQLALYQAGVQDLVQEIGKPVRVEFEIVTKTKNPVVERLYLKDGGESLDRQVKAATLVLEAVERGIYIPSPGWQCSSCRSEEALHAPARDLCPGPVSADDHRRHSGSLGDELGHDQRRPQGRSGAAKREDHLARPDSYCDRRDQPEQGPEVAPALGSRILTKSAGVVGGVDDCAVTVRLRVTWVGLTSASIWIVLDPETSGSAASKAPVDVGAGARDSAPARTVTKAVDGETTPRTVALKEDNVAPSRGSRNVRQTFGGAARSTHTGIAVVTVVGPTVADTWIRLDPLFKPTPGAVQG